MTTRFETQSEPIAGYRLIERLGSGGFGEVWKAEAPGGIFKAVKIIFGDMRAEDGDTNRFAEQEMKALKRVKQVRHPYLLALDRFDVVDGRLMIVMELADCNLWDRFRQCRKQGLPGIPREELLGYMFESAEVLDLMNDQFQLQHLDIKPQNLFLLYNHVKVADFGQVKDLEGVVASVTGGITPVYAAPETFDGVITRFCDQYSLACVYQELLTGQRPFDGTSMQQLLMQHLQLPPNLGPAPSADRPALKRALSKKPEDRFPSITAFVKALRDGTAGDVPTVLPSSASGAISQSGAIGVSLTQAPVQPSQRIEVRPDAQPEPWPTMPRTSSPASIPAPPAPTEPLLWPASGSSSYLGPQPSGSSIYPPPASRSGDLLTPPITNETLFSAKEAPPEETGPGPIRPALVIGIGGTGLRVLQRLRKVVGDRFGPPSQTPTLRLLYVDTDPDAPSLAASVPAGLSPIPPEDVFPARLNRAGHYLKPRLNGRSLIEGWFDNHLLYKLPRNPVTMGVRAFGRLAFCDHYRALMLKVQAELDAAVEPAALAATHAHTGLDLRTNRPRVYIVAGLAGGTGGGMFLDMAYAVRSKLARMGYEPDVEGVLFVPPDAPAGLAGDPLTLANTYAALTELHHFSRPETMFSAGYDDRTGTVRDTDPPFARLHLLPDARSAGAGAGGGSGVIGAAAVGRASGVTGSQFLTRGTNTPRGRLAAVGTAPPDKDPASAAAEYLRLDLFSPVGRLADENRPAGAPADGSHGLHLRTFGLVRFGWPRAEIVARTSRAVIPVVVNPWVNSDPGRARGAVPQWVGDRWSKLGLEPDVLVEHFLHVIDAAAGGRVEDVVQSLTEPLVPKGWLGRLPDAERVSVALDQMTKLFGRPGLAGKGPMTAVDQAVKAAADRFRARLTDDLPRIVLDLVDDSGFRPAGAEEAIRQMDALAERLRGDFEKQADDLEAVALSGYDLLSAHVYYQRGMRKPTAAEFADAVRHLPRSRARVVALRGVADVLASVRTILADTAGDVAQCRQRLAGVVPQMAPVPGPIPDAGTRDLLPPGCTSVEDSIQKFLRVLTDDDLQELDARIQYGLVQAFGGLYQACLNSTDGLAGVVRVVREETRRYLDERLGEVDFAGMFWAKFGQAGASGQTAEKAYHDAEPALVGPGPWAKTEVRVYAGPTGPGGDPLREIIVPALPEGLIETVLPDEAVIYREFPDVPLAALPQLGPLWSNAYRSAIDTFQAPAHTRTDVTRWIDVDAV